MSTEAINQTIALEKAARASQQAAAAAIAGGIIAAAGRPHSIDEALQVFTSVFYAMHPQHGNGGYERWKAEGRTDKAHT